jgi:hypothetical protein
MVLLCAGVLIAGTTLRSFAASYSVTATVQAPLPTSAATITSPTASQHVTTNVATVSGTCPAQSYVKLSRNGNVSGVSQCASNSYQIQTSLTSGTNQLAAQVYSLTDSPGPASPSVTVYYDQIVSGIIPTAPPDSTPVTLTVSDVENTGYKTGRSSRTSGNPTVSGYAPPLSMMTVTFHSDPETCITQADATGWWTCTLGATLPAGQHHVDVVAVTTDGQRLVFPTFQITVDGALPNLLKPALANAADPLLLRADYHYEVHVGRQAVDLALGVTGGTQPYVVTTDWGDGTTTKLTRADTSPFTVSHTYDTPSGPNKSYTVLVRAADAQGGSSLMQLSVVVKGDGITLLAAGTTFGNFLDGVQHWLWIIMPAYVVVVLMAIGYYLGEREEYRQLALSKKRLAPAARAK